MPGDNNPAAPLDAVAVSPVMRWVLGSIMALLLASVPALVTWGAMGARLDAVEKDQIEAVSEVKEQAKILPAIEARLSAEERRTLEHEAALQALRSDSARTAEAVAETNGILKVLLKN